jgi:nucleotide-binding universal stress UspA family protein
VDSSFNVRVVSNVRPSVGTFKRIVCGIDGNPAALEGVRQAAALAAPSGRIELLSVTDEFAVSPVSSAPDERHAADALAQASAELAGRDVAVRSRSVMSVGAFAWQWLLEAAGGADLLVVGRHSLTRAEGILIDGTTTNVVHRAELPVLVAVEPPEGRPFPGRILVAADGPGHPEDAVRVASAIAQRHASDVILLRVASEHRVSRPAVATAVAELLEATGRRPIELVVDGQPHRAIAEYALRERASLVITGSRGMTSLDGLHSVSERVAHEAPCSVLVLRSPAHLAATRDLPYA